MTFAPRACEALRPERPPHVEDELLVTRPFNRRQGRALAGAPVVVLLERQLSQPLQAGRPPASGPAAGAQRVPGSQLGLHSPSRTVTDSKHRC